MGKPRTWYQEAPEVQAVLTIVAMWECPTCGHHNLVQQDKVLDGIDRCEECMDVIAVSPPGKEVANA